MIKFSKTHIFVLSLSLVCLVAVSMHLWPKSAKNSNGVVLQSQFFTDTISKIVAYYPGEIGVAVIINNTDTITVNNKSIYPMMSVFKVHQALAICDDFGHKGFSLDSLMTIHRDELDPQTWSPMMKEHLEPVIPLRVKDLLCYTLILSDNNASNFMFKKLVNITQTDSFIATLIPRLSFQIAYTLGAAILMNRLFTDSLIDYDKQQFIIKTLEQCSTGKDRIAAPLLDKDGITIAHKTGSGYTNENGVLAAHNDVAYIRLPNGICYTLAVFVKDFKGNETQAAKAIAHISAIVYSLVTQTIEHS